MVLSPGKTESGGTMMESASFGLGHVDPSPDSNLAIGLAMLYDVPKGTTFYYDETNNIRKFWLTPDDFNAGHNKDFILGGVSYPDDGFKGERAREFPVQYREVLP